MDVNHTTGDQAGSSQPDLGIPRSDKTDGGHSVLRVWPAVVLLAVLLASRLVMNVADATIPVAMVWFMGPSLLMGFALVWWLLFSRALLREKLTGFIGILLIGVVTTLLADVSVRGFATVLYAAPVGIAGFAAGLILFRRRSPTVRTGIALMASLVCFGYWDLLRLEGMWGNWQPSFSWRWAKTNEDQFLASLNSLDRVTEATGHQQLPVANAEWPGFRGPHRDAVVPGVVLREDWGTSPPREVWRIKVGPAWSSFRGCRGAFVHSRATG